eukprot:5386976-Pleurochrysis_carterae.AAC.1
MAEDGGFDVATYRTRAFLLRQRTGRVCQYALPRPRDVWQRLSQQVPGSNSGSWASRPGSDPELVERANREVDPL